MQRQEMIVLVASATTMLPRKGLFYYFSRYQNNLLFARTSIRLKKEVLVELSRDTDNPKDKNAIIIKANIDGQLHLLGYVGLQHIPKVAAAMTKKEFVEITVKHVTSWFVKNTNERMMRGSLLLCKTGQWLSDAQDNMYNPDREAAVAASTQEISFDNTVTAANGNFDNSTTLGYNRSVITNENIASQTGIRIPAQQITTNLNMSNYGAAAYIPLGRPLYMKINGKLKDRIISKDFVEMSNILVDHHPSEVDLHLAVQNKRFVLRKANPYHPSLTEECRDKCEMECTSNQCSETKSDIPSEMEQTDNTIDVSQSATDVVKQVDAYNSAHYSLHDFCPVQERNTQKQFLESTAELENFQNLILKYASTCHSFNPVSYSARNLLAALDNNAHCQRQMMVNKDGSTRRYYRKTGIQRSVYAKREDKDYHHVPTIIKIIVENRLQDHVGMNRKVLLDVNDPRRVSAVLAPTLPPSTADLVAQKISRFNKEDPEKTLDYSWTDGLMSVQLVPVF
ncbi:unnamed protein product [Mytilus edulis]|uniref:Uncharacterized protein n=1 Tax=Mytilus edulis TaxID=6550 RepID=A0A8S3S8X8_MYTED|nr:unnamed protein product [Mytilus edulis]